MSGLPERGVQCRGRCLISSTAKARVATLLHPLSFLPSAPQLSDNLIAPLIARAESVGKTQR